MIITYKENITRSISRCINTSRLKRIACHHIRDDSIDMSTNIPNISWQLYTLRLNITEIYISAKHV